MSGGSYNYIGSTLKMECAGRMYDAEMNGLIVDLCKVLHDLEWWQSCDSSEEDYRKTVAKFKEKWFQYSRKGEWIPVSKGLPEVGHVVYCQLADGSHEILFLDDYPGGQMTWVGRRIRDYKVTAWREMPEPYKAEKGGE